MIKVRWPISLTEPVDSPYASRRIPGCPASKAEPDPESPLLAAHRGSVFPPYPRCYHGDQREERTSEETNDYDACH